MPTALKDRVLFLALVSAPIIGMVSALGVAPLLGLAAVGVLGLGGWRHWRQLTLPPVATAALVLALIWAAISCSWSESGTAFAIKAWGQTLGVMLGGWILVGAARRLPDDSLDTILRGLAAALFLTLGITLLVGVTGRFVPAAWFGLYDRAFINYSLHFDRDMAICALLYWPALYGLRQRRATRQAIILTLLAAVSLSLNQALAAKMAFWGGWAIWLLEAKLPRWGVQALRAGMVAFLLAFPVVADHFPPRDQIGHWLSLNSSIRHRMIIWQFTANLIDQKPLLGWGYESARTLGHKETFSVPVGDGLALEGELLPLHPHNGTLQIWLELGAGGIVLVALLFWSVLGQLRHRHLTPMAPYGTAMAWGAFFIGNVGYGIWQSWWTSTIWISAALLAAIAARRPGAAILKGENGVSIETPAQSGQLIISHNGHTAHYGLADIQSVTPFTHNSLRLVPALFRRLSWLLLCSPVGRMVGRTPTRLALALCQRQMVNRMGLRLIVAGSTHELLLLAHPAWCHGATIRGLLPVMGDWLHILRPATKPHSATP